MKTYQSWKLLWVGAALLGLSDASYAIPKRSVLQQMPHAAVPADQQQDIELVQEPLRKKKLPLWSHEEAARLVARATEHLQSMKGGETEANKADALREVSVLWHGYKKALEAKVRDSIIKDLRKERLSLSGQERVKVVSGIVNDVIHSLLMSKEPYDEAKAEKSVKDVTLIKVVQLQKMQAQAKKTSLLYPAPASTSAIAHVQKRFKEHLKEQMAKKDATGGNTETQTPAHSGTKHLG